MVAEGAGEITALSDISKNGVVKPSEALMASVDAPEIFSVALNGTLSPTAKPPMPNSVTRAEKVNVAVMAVGKVST